MVRMWGSAGDRGRGRVQVCGGGDGVVCGVSDGGVVCRFGDRCCMWGL